MYDEHYGLSGRPFQLTPDPRFWFDTATHKRAMAYLGYGLSQGEGFIVVTGEIGAGKTTLMGHLVESVDRDRLNVVTVVSTQIAAADLLRGVCTGMGLEPGDASKAELLRLIERGLHAAARAGKRTLLIVDEAQALPVDSLEELRMLSNFTSGGFALLQIFLLGQPEFRERLQDERLEQLRQRVIAMHHLGEMDADELEGYLAHRLSVVGWTGNPDFDEDAVEAIYAWSGGIPRRVNQLAGRVMLMGALEGIDRFTGAHVADVIADLEGSTPLRPRAELPTATPPVIEAVTAPEPAPVAVVEPAPVQLIVPDAEIEPDPFVDATLAIAPESEAIPETTDALPLPIHDAEPEPAPLLVHVEPEPEAELVSDEVPEPEATPAGEDAEVAPEPAHSASVIDLDSARRLAELEKRMEEQDVALRRVLALLVDWVEGDEHRPDVSALHG